MKNVNTNKKEKTFKVKVAPRVFEVKEEFEFPIEGGDVLQLEPGDMYEPLDGVVDIYPVASAELPVDVQPELMVASLAIEGRPQLEVAQNLTKKFGMTESQAVRTTQLFWPSSSALSESIFRKGTSQQSTKTIRFDSHSPKN